MIDISVINITFRDVRICMPIGMMHVMLSTIVKQPALTNSLWYLFKAVASLREGSLWYLLKAVASLKEGSLWCLFKAVVPV